MKYLIQGKYSGLFYGEIEKQIDSEIKIINVRQIWRWCGARNLAQLAAEGSTKPNDCKITIQIPEITIIDCIEIVSCSEKCINCFNNIPEWKI